MNAREQWAQADQDIDRLAAIWLDHRRSAEQARQDASDVITAATARRDGSTGQMSAAYELLRDWVLSVDPAGLVTRCDDALVHLRTGGCERALRLAEVVWAKGQAYVPQRRAQALALIEAHGDARADARPPAERFWTEVALCTLYCSSARYAEALAHGLQAESLARGADIELLRGHAMHSLGCVFLSVGDSEAAVSVLRKSLHTFGRLGIRDPKAGYHLLLALVVGKRFADAEQVLVQHPWLCEPARMAGAPILRSVVARVRLANGHAAAAAALISIEAPPQITEPMLAQVNRAWMEGDILLLLGRPEEARERVDACLAAAQAAGTALLSMHVEQLHRVQSEAWELMGELRESLAALKRSQAARFIWVGESQRARVQALQIGTAAPRAQTQAQRLQLLNDTVARAHREATDEAAARHKRFVAQVMHEMRNPLNGVIGMTSLLLMSDLDQRQHQYANLARSSAEMLKALCDDLLDLSKLDSGKFELLLQPADVGGLLHEVLQLLAPLAQTGGVELRLRVDPALPTQLQCDRLRLQQVVMNLLGNAIKFTRKGSIDLVAEWRPDARRESSGELYVAVRDTGRGLTAEDRSRLFQEFALANDAMASPASGSGLGLALCRSLLQQMGGVIDVDSVVGQGSTFWFSLPLQLPLAA